MSDAQDARQDAREFVIPPDIQDAMQMEATVFASLVADRTLRKADRRVFSAGWRCAVLAAMDRVAHLVDRRIEVDVADATAKSVARKGTP